MILFAWFTILMMILMMAMKIVKKYDAEKVLNKTLLKFGFCMFDNNAISEAAGVDDDADADANFGNRSGNKLLAWSVL